MVNPSEPSHGVSRVVHHKDFYLRGGDMTVLVENHLYRIHSYFFERESLFFRQKFSTVEANDDAGRGSTDSNAYTLEDVKSEDFARFLWVFYNPKYSVYEAPLETWLSILKLSNRWTFDSVKELAVRELEKIEIEPVEKIAIYHDNTISRLYLIPSYIAVCKRDKHLSFSEGMKLGMETVLRIAEARERMRLQASESGVRSPTFEDFEDSDVEVLIREIFSLGSRPASPHSSVPAHNGTNGTTNGTIKLGEAPPGKPAKVVGAFAPRANGGSATDPRGSSVDSLSSIASIIAQAPEAAPEPATASTTATQPTVTQKPLTSTPPATTTQAAGAAAQPPPPPPPTDKPTKSQALENRLSSLLSPLSGGVGEPSSPAGSQACSDVLNTKPVVPSEHNNDVTAKSDDKTNDLKKDDETASVQSDADSSKGRQAQRNKGGRGASRGGRGGK